MPLDRLAGFSLVLAVLFFSVSAGCLVGKAPSASQETAPVILVDYTRNGGPTGVEDRLVIFDNGAALVVTKNTSRNSILNSTEIERISSVFEQAQFSDLQENYPSHHATRGLYHYSISYKEKTVTLEELSYPAVVGPVINELDQIVSSNTPEKVPIK